VSVVGSGIYDVAVIGAGVVGAAIARELSQYELSVALIDAAGDVGTGTTKANTAIHHTGFDAEPGSLEALLLRRSYRLLSDYARVAGIPRETPGALLVAWNDEQLARLDGLLQRAHANGVDDVAPLRMDELQRREPHLAPGARGALEIPGEGIICPFTTPLAFATEAVLNGVRLILDAPVRWTQPGSGARPHLLGIPAGPLAAHWVVNAAGLSSDLVDGMFGHERFRLRPRRGQLIVFDKFARRLVSGIILPVPSEISKGVLIAPTVFGNLLVGPTAEELEDREDTATTPAGIAELIARGYELVPELAKEDVTATYAGLRAAADPPGYQIHCEAAERYVCVGGIRSTGLSASMGIATYVTELMADAGLGLRRAGDHRSVRMPPIGERQRRPHRDERAIAQRPAYGEIVCHCERVTRGELLDALDSPLPPRTLDGLRRRTRAMLGRCQGFYCQAAVTAFLAERTGTPPAALVGLNVGQSRSRGCPMSRAGAMRLEPTRER
jgi:glycerol-3-phosphate dehydrogenase